MLPLLLAIAALQIEVSVNGIETGHSCRIQNIATEAEAATGEQVNWDKGSGVDIRIFCRRATGDLVSIKKNVRGKQSFNLKMGFAIIWTERDGDRIDARVILKRKGGDEVVEAAPGAQTPLLAGDWSAESFDDEKNGWRKDSLKVRQGATVERSTDLSSGKIRLGLNGGKGQVELLRGDGSSAGYGPAGSWIVLPPNRYHITVVRHEDLAQVAHRVGEVVLRPNAELERSANPVLGILKWALKEPLGELKVYDESGEKLLAEGLRGERWKLSPGSYRLSYQLPSNAILAQQLGAKAKLIEVRAGRSTSFGDRPVFGQAIVRLRRGNAPQYGHVEILNPADGELAGRFNIGQMVKIAPGSWPLRAVASDGKVITHDKPLVIRHGKTTSVDLQRKQSRLRVNLSKDGKHAKGLWQVLRSGSDEPKQAVSGEAMDLDPGEWLLRLKCASGRGGQERKITLQAGVDLEEEFLCN
ncbi:MAG: hypothetical protein OSB21_09935 [Myxococcota bacterium]|nr:hypothetical protein [Myxococcota bacterium]